MDKEEYIFYYVRLKPGNNLRLQFKDGSMPKVLTPSHRDGIKVTANCWKGLQADPRVELVKEVVLAGAEELIIDEKIHESMIASYEAQLNVEKSKITKRDKVIRRLNLKIESLQRELTDKKTLQARMILCEDNKAKKQLTAELEDIEVVRKLESIVVDTIKKHTNTKRLEEFLPVIRMRKAELEGKIEPVKTQLTDEEVAEQQEEVSFDELLKEIAMKGEEEE